MFPTFTLVQNQKSDTTVTGSLSTLSHGTEKWVADGWLGCLLYESCISFGRWREASEVWIFTPENPADSKVLCSQREWTVLDQYWGERAELVLNPKRIWRRTEFTPQASVWIDKSGNREDVAGGWDHEHCGICWARIGKDGEPEGYLSQPEAWVCTRCYEAYVATRSLDFIP